jgi:death-on-curing protein
VSEFIWIELDEALAVHARVLALHGGASGVRDQRLLESGLARARQQAAYAEIVDTVALAAAVTAGIVRNHPFVDGNKRTGFVVGILFLELNGFDFHATEEDAANAVLALAAGSLEEQDYAAFLRQNSTARARST